MENNQKEDTKELFELSDIENNPKQPVLDIEQEVIDINEQMDTIQETMEGIEKLSDNIEQDKKKEKIKLKDKIKNKWNAMTKKKKIIFIISLVLIIIALAVGIFFAVKHFTKKDNAVKEEEVVFEADNYRYENGFLIFLDAKDQELGKYECENKDEKLCYVAYNEIEENLDITKKVDEEDNVLKTRSNILLDKYVFVHDNKDEEKILLYNIKEQKKLEEYNGVKTNINIKDYAIVKDYSNSYGLLNFTEDNVETKIDFNYDNLSIITEDKTENKVIIANESGRNYLIDYTEKSISKAINKEIVNYNNEYILAIDDTNKYYIYDYKNNQMFEDGYDYAKLYDGYVLIVKDNKLYFYDNNKNKLNETGIDFTLDHKYYQKIVIYDKDNNKLDSYVPFEVATEGSNIVITINGKTKTINKEEGRISSYTKYINYFDGILYVYNDDAKTNLVGQYKCSNLNTVTSESSSFDNCFIASDTSSVDNDMTFTTSSGMIPILNQRYIFIKDNPNAVSNSNTTIALYDLNDKKVLSKYLSVNTNLNTNSTDVSYLTDSNINIIAENKSSKYGVIAINGDSKLTSLIPFNYNSIEIIGDNYLVNDSKGYSLIDKTGKEITKKTSGKIRGYNSSYIKVLEGNSYVIYDLNGNKITNNTFNYVELYNEYFIGVDSSNKINVYSYTDSSKALLSESIQLNSNNYCGNGQLAFKAAFNGTTVTISVLNNNQYSSAVYTLVSTIETEVE